MTYREYVESILIPEATQYKIKIDDIVEIRIKPEDLYGVRVYPDSVDALFTYTIFVEYNGSIVFICSSQPKVDVETVIIYDRFDNSIKYPVNEFIGGYLRDRKMNEYLKSLENDLS